MPRKKVEKKPVKESAIEPATFSMDPGKVEKKLREGWIKSWMMIESLAVTDAAVRSSLEGHIRKMGLENGVIIAKKDFKRTEKVDKPFANIETAYSGVVELEVLTPDYDRLVFLVLNYAPSAIEVLEPKRISMDAGEAQGILNSLAELIHRFVGMTRGGIMVDTK
jgi:hypothetical protein